MPLSRTIPALPVSDVRAAATFYVERLGFEVLHLDDGIAVLRRDDAVLHLWPAADDGWRERASGDRPVRSGAESFLAGTASCRIEVDDPDSLTALYAELSAARVLHGTDTGQPEDTDFGTTEFHVLDQDGNLISFHRWHARS